VRNPCNRRGFVVPGATHRLDLIRDVAQMLHMPIWSNEMRVRTRSRLEQDTEVLPCRTRRQ